METVEELQDQIEVLEQEIRALADLDDITEEQDADLDAKLDQRDALVAERAKAQDRAQRLAFIEEERAAGRVHQHDGHDAGIQVMDRVDPFDTDDVRRLSHGEARDRAMKLLEGAQRDLGDHQLAHAEKVFGTLSGDCDGGKVAKRAILTENETYRSAFMKGVLGREVEMSDAERRAISEVRAMDSDVADGGYGIPVLIDPTIILTSGAADAPLLAISRVESITTNVWKGVSSAAVSWSFDGADPGTTPTEVSDDAVTLAQPTVTTYTAQGFVPYSIGISEDYPGFAAEMRRLIEQGYVDLLASQLATGSGTAPQGIFTALDANTNVEVVVTTDGAFGVEDVRAVWASLPERYRARANWFMHTDVANEVESFGGASTGAGDYTIDLASANVMQIKGRPVVLSDYAPEFTGTTGAANILIVGDFSNFLIAQRVGMTIENIPHLFGVTTGRPISQRGWYARARVGSDSVNDNGFRLLQNQ